MITEEIKKQLEQLAKAKECPACQTLGKWKLENATKGITVIPKTAVSPGKRDFENPMLAGFIVCLQCGHRGLVDLQPAH